MITTIRELWNGEWWRWYLRDGKPYAFVRDASASERMMYEASFHMAQPRDK